MAGLMNGRYDLRINSKVVGTWDDRAFAVHAEIEEDPDSPTHQQAMQVIELNRKRNKEGVSPLRGLWARQKGMFNKRETDKAAYDAWQAEFKTKRTELEALAAKYEDEIYQINKPQPLKIEVVPSSQPPPAKPQPNPAAKAPEKKAA